MKDVIVVNSILLIQYLFFYLTGMSVYQFCPQIVRRFHFYFFAIIGVALSSFLLTPLSQLGIPVSRGLLFLALFTLYGLFRFIQILRQRKMRWTYDLLVFIGLALLISFFYCAIIKYGSPSIYSPWGSTDIFSYMFSSNFITHHGGDAASYWSQSTLRYWDYENHLTIHGRLGSHVVFSLMRLLVPVASNAWTLNIFTAFFLWSSVLTVMGIFRIFKYRESVPFFLLVIGQIFYFNIYYTYLSQAYISHLFIFLQFCAFIFIFRKKNEYFKYTFLLVLLFGSCLVSYATSIVMYPLFLLFMVLFRYRRWDWKNFLWLGLSYVLAVLYSLFYIERSIAEIRYVMGIRGYMGWVWNKFISFPEFIGLSPVLGYGNLTLTNIWTWVLVIFVVLAWFWNMKKTERLYLFFILTPVSILALIPVYNFLIIKMPIATHGINKFISFYHIPISASLLFGFYRLLKLANNRFLTICLLGLFSYRSIAVLFMLQPQAQYIRPDYMAYLEQIKGASENSFFVVSNFDDIHNFQLFYPALVDNYERIITKSDTFLEKYQQGGKIYSVYRNAANQIYQGPFPSHINFQDKNFPFTTQVVLDKWASEQKRYFENDSDIILEGRGRHVEVEFFEDYLPPRSAEWQINGKPVVLDYNSQDKRKAKLNLPSTHTGYFLIRLICPDKKCRFPVLGMSLKGDS